MPEQEEINFFGIPIIRSDAKPICTLSLMLLRFLSHTRTQQLSSENGKKKNNFRIKRN